VVGLRKARWSLILTAYLISLVLLCGQGWGLSFRFLRFLKFSSDEKASSPFIYRAKMVSIAPVIDGVLDDPAWKEAEEGVLGWNATEGEEWKGNEDFEGRFKVVWKGGTLYVALRFRDDRLEMASIDFSKRDSVEIYVDMNRYAPRSHSNRYTIPFGESKPCDNVDRVYSAWSKDGTVFEASFTLDRPPALGMVIGFDICYDDVDGDYKKQIRWTDESLNNRRKPLLGDLILEGMEDRPARKAATTWGRIKSLY